MRIAELAATGDNQIHPHTSIPSLNMAASIHFLCAIANSGYFEAEISAINPFRNELSSPGFTAHDDGAVQPLDRPGLGVDVDEGLIEKFVGVAGPGYV